jgi:hypothetical protein
MSIIETFTDPAIKNANFTKASSIAPRINAKERVWPGWKRCEFGLSFAKTWIIVLLEVE